LIDELRTSALAASPGPWRHAQEHGLVGSIEDCTGNLIAQAQQLPDLSRDNRRALAQRTANARHIAAANPVAVLALIEAYEALSTQHRPTRSAQPGSDELEGRIDVDTLPKPGAN
jgi:hypothetical protein